jgi:hypothetical protein
MINVAFRCIVLHDCHPGYFINMDAICSGITWLHILYKMLSALGCHVKARLTNHSRCRVDPRQTQFMGGGVKPHSLKGQFLKLYCPNSSDINGKEYMEFDFIEYIALKEASPLCTQDSNLIQIRLPIEHLADCLTRDELRKIATLHNIPFRTRHRKPALKALLTNHTCDVCDEYVSLFRSPVINLSDKSSKCTPVSLNDFPDDKPIHPSPIRSHSSRILQKSFLWPYCVDDYTSQEHEGTNFLFVQYVSPSEASNLCHQDRTLIPFHLPMQPLAELLSRDELRKMASLHNVCCLSSD